MNRDMYYNSYGYSSGYPNNQMMPYMNQYNPFSNIENRILRIENNINKLNQRISKLESKNNENIYNNEPDNNLYML